MHIRIVVLVLIAVTFPLTALADIATNDTNYTYSTKTITDTTNTAVMGQQVDTFAVELIGRMQGSSTALYDQTFNLAFADPTVQAAVLTLEGVLTANGAASFIGPNLFSSNTSLVNSFMETSAVTLPINLDTDVSAVTTTYIGDFPSGTTIMVGDNQSQAFTLLPGQIDYDTLITTLVHQIITTTTTNTYLTRMVYEVEGVAAVTPPSAPVPEPATLGLMAIGLLGLSGVARRKRIAKR